MKINAATRLTAVDLAPQSVFTDTDGDWMLAKLQKRFNTKKTRIGKDRNGLVFWWVTPKYLVCTDKDKVVAYISFYSSPKKMAVENEKGRLNVRQISTTYVDPPYRGKGLVLGMHQYLVTQSSLLSDDIYTPQGIAVWHRLKQMGYKIETVQVGGGRIYVDPSLKWSDRDALLLIRGRT